LIASALDTDIVGCYYSLLLRSSTFDHAATAGKCPLPVHNHHESRTTGGECPACNP